MSTDRIRNHRSEDCDWSWANVFLFKWCFPAQAGAIGNVFDYLANEWRLNSKRFSAPYSWSKKQEFVSRSFLTLAIHKWLMQERVAVGVIKRFSVRLYMFFFNQIIRKPKNDGNIARKISFNIFLAAINNIKAATNSFVKLLTVGYPAPSMHITVGYNQYFFLLQILRSAGNAPFCFVASHGGVILLANGP